MEFCAKSDKGKSRKINQDSYGYYLSETGLGYFIVADGMGGHSAGEVASAIAADTFIDGAKENKCTGGFENVKDFIERTFKRANDTILYKAAADPEMSGMGSTMVAAVILDNEIIIGNLGDSRAYMVKSGSISQITSDHSYVDMLLKAGSIDEESARNHPRRNEITKAVGIKSYSDPDVFRCEYESGDMLILCSDGLNKMIDDSKIPEIAENKDSPEEICDKLIEAANAGGGLDNITVIAVLL